MSQNRVGSIVVVDELGLPQGIVTDTDLRDKVLAAGVSPESPVSSIMSSPVLTATPQITSASAILQMIRHRVRHICLTEDGTALSRATGVVSEHDIALLHGSNPALLVKKISQSSDVSDLARARDEAEAHARQYVSQGVSLAFVRELVAAVNDLTLEKLLQFGKYRLRIEGAPDPALRFCWLSFGSDGRREQIMRTDQDNALIYEDPPAGQEQETRRYYLRLGKIVTEGLCRCGYAPCPGGDMASSASWCRSLSEWERTVAHWVGEPEESALLNSATFFDFRSSAGDTSLANELHARLSALIRSHQIVVILMAKNAVRGLPALTAFGKFALERKGHAEGRFDIKLRAMKPLSDAARVLAMDGEHLAITGTVERFRKVASSDPSVASVASDAEMAYDLFLRHRVLRGIGGPDQGRYIELGTMNHMERAQLRDALRCIRPVQTLLRVRFQLNTLGLQ